MASMKELNSTLKQQKFLFLGAGEVLLFSETDKTYQIQRMLLLVVKFL